MNSCFSFCLPNSPLRATMAPAFSRLTTHRAYPHVRIRHPDRRAFHSGKGAAVPHSWQAFGSRLCNFSKQFVIPTKPAPPRTRIMRADDADARASRLCEYGATRTGNNQAVERAARKLRDRRPSSETHTHARAGTGKNRAGERAVRRLAEDLENCAQFCVFR